MCFSPQFPQNQNTLLQWLQLVSFHSKSTSTEDLANLAELSQNPPDVDNPSKEVCDVFNQVKVSVDNKKWNPKLSSISQLICESIREQLNQASNNTKTLNYSDTVINCEAPPFNVSDIRDENSDSEDLATDLIGWLQLVEFHGQSTSIDDLGCIKSLALNIPRLRDPSAEINEIIKRVKLVAEKQMFDNKLSPMSKQACESIRLNPTSIRLCDFPFEGSNSDSSEEISEEILAIEESNINLLPEPKPTTSWRNSICNLDAYWIDSLRINLDILCDFIPFASTLTNIINLFQKCIIFSSEEISKSPDQDRYWRYIDNKDNLRCALLAVPFLNVLVAIYYY